MKEEITPGCIPPGETGHYSIGFDPAAPNGDKSITVVFDREKNAIVQIVEGLQPDPNRVADDLKAYLREHRAKDPEWYFRNPAGVDDQGEAVVIEPIVLPSPETGSAAA